MSVQSHAKFLATKRWSQLDGLRTVSIAFVIVAHMGDAWFPTFKGALGVILFFVISGFLITSLLIREEIRDGSVSLSGFYIRRVFRIVPLYFLALAAAAILVLGAGLGSGRESFLARLPLLATFNGDFAIYGTFVHAWSIGIEEKFYVFWPLIGFALLPLRRHRGLILAILLPLCAVAAYVPSLRYMGIYTAILAGCALAVAMHTPRGYELAFTLAGPKASAALVTLAVLTFVFDGRFPQAQESGLAHVPFAIAVTLIFPAIVVGNGWLQRALAWRPLVYFGTRSYGVYLFHPFCIDVINRVIPNDQTEFVPVIVRLVAASVVSLLVAEVLFRAVEKPLIDVGRRISDGLKRPANTVVQIIA